MQSDSKTFVDACILAVDITTNVPQGGDAGHGGRTTLTFRDEGGFAFGNTATGMPPESVRIDALGDAEARVLADALLWAGKRLSEMIGNSSTS